MKPLKYILVIILSMLMLVLLVSCKKNNDTEEEIKLPEGTYYTASFETNGGSTIKDKQITKQENLDKPTTPTRENYEFEGWYLDQTLTVPAVFPIKMDSDKTLYASWLKISDKTTCADAIIKFWANNDSSSTYSITPTGFDFEKLDVKGYSFKITVSYEVYYEKDYDIPFEIGYAGAPKFEAYIADTTGRLSQITNATAEKSAQVQQLEYTAKIGDVKNERFSLVFSTDNIQNKVHFEKITITYECIK